MSTLAEQVVEQLKTDMDNVYDAGYQKGKSEGGIFPIDYLSSYFNIENKEEWVVGEFTLLSDVSSGYLTISNPAGQVPKEFVVFTKTLNKLVEKLQEISYGDQVLVGGYNIGNILDDHDDNRTIIIRHPEPKSQIFCSYSMNSTEYNLVNASCPSVGTSENLYFRTGTQGQTKWYAGEYYVAVRV